MAEIAQWPHSASVAGNIAEDSKGKRVVDERYRKWFKAWYHNEDEDFSAR